MTPFSLYVHIPYCTHKCPYCDFNTYAVTSIPEIPYRNALIKEIKTAANNPLWKGREVQTIFFGGGTPSLFSPESIEAIIQQTANCFPIFEPLEVTLEANPGMMTEERVDGFSLVGINRLSLGAQSFQPRILSVLGRRHTAEHIHRAFNEATRAGIKNISVDLIFGVPSETLEELNADLLELMKLNATHVSLYGLTIEEGTPFFRDVQDGKIIMPEDDLVADMMKEIHIHLTAAGLKRYEISNYSKPKFESRHNKNYWSGGDYLGIGAGAHSAHHQKNSGTRWSNRAKPADYIEQIEASGEARAWMEKLTEEKLRNEFFMLGLRRSEGVSADRYKELFGREIEEDFRANLLVLSEAGLISWDAKDLKLTDNGILLANSIIEEFIVGV